MTRVLRASLTFAMGVAALRLAVKPAAANNLETLAGGVRIFQASATSGGGL